MALGDILAADVNKIFKETWLVRKGQIVPEPEGIKLGNEAVEFERVTVLYADLSGSTKLVDASSWQFAAGIYKAFLLCAAKLIRVEGGTITSYDGDRVMGVFVGDGQVTNAVRCGLKINYAVEYIIGPSLGQNNLAYAVKQVVGIDTSAIRAARTGVRGGNDIVWVGRAANYAAKLTELNSPERTWITKDVYDLMNNEVRYGGSANANMWTQYRWEPQNNYPIYGSTYWWKV